MPDTATMPVMPGMPEAPKKPTLSEILDKEYDPKHFEKKQFTFTKEGSAQVAPYNLQATFQNNVIEKTREALVNAIVLGQACPRVGVADPTKVFVHADYADGKFYIVTPKVKTPEKKA
jgi:hypothetical protein